MAKRKRKRRKRVSREIPAKGRMRDMCDKLWSLAVRADWLNCCAVCGQVSGCEAHHLVPREHEATRYDLMNGISLCYRHHQADKDLSPHMNAAGWMDWLKTHHPERAQWYHENRRPTFEGTKNPQYYIDTLMRLRDYVEPFDFERVCCMEFTAYLLENHLDSE